MPYSDKQRAAIAADMRRQGKSREEISAFFRAHGHAADKGLRGAMRDQRKRHTRSANARKAAHARHDKKRARPRRRTSGGRVQRGSSSY